MSWCCLRHLVTTAPVLAVAIVAALDRPVAAQNATKAGGGGPGEAATAGVELPPGYVIGPDDQLSVMFWREKEMSADVAVRPDGKISLPLINDIEATGLTPEELRANITEAAAKFVTDPTVSVVVKQINSRKVFITGQVPKPGPYPLTGPLTVLQLIAMAGGVHEYANEENIVIVREEKGRQIDLRFNYKDVSRRRNLEQNVLLQPGDTVIVP